METPSLIRNHHSIQEKEQTAKTASLHNRTVRVTQCPEPYALRPVIFMTALPAGKDTVQYGFGFLQ